MDLSTQYQNHLQHQQQQQTYDPSQVQTYDQSTQAYYAYHQYNPQYPYYTQDYTNAYQKESQEEPTSIHPPGVPIPPEPTHAVAPQQWLGQTDGQNSYRPQGVVDQQQQQKMNSSDSGVTAGMNPTAAAAVAQRAMVVVPEQQWQGNSRGFGTGPMHGGSHQRMGQTPYMRGGRRAGRPLKGGGPGHFGWKPDGSVPSFRGRGLRRGRGQFSAPAENPAAFEQGGLSHTQGEPSPYSSGPAQALLAAPAHAHITPTWPPPNMAWCDLCRVDCNTLEILEQHRNGKKHKKNMKLYEELQELNRLRVGGQNEKLPVPEVQQEVTIQPEKVEGSGEKQHPPENLSSQAVTDKNKVETEQQNVSQEVESAEEPARKLGMDHFKNRERGFKRKMRGGRGGKWMRTHEGSRRPVEPPKPKQVIPLICELCNVKCDSQVVFESHLTGKKHLSNLERFQGQQAILGQAALQALYPALQALYPALQALYPPNPNATTSLAPQFHQGSSGSQGLIPQPAPLMSHPGQASVPGLAIASASAPPPVLENQDHQNPKLEHSRVMSEAVSQDSAKGEARSQQ